MPPKQKKKGATSKVNSAAKEAAAVPEKPAAKSVAASEEVPPAAAAEKEPLPDAGVKRPLEPEVPTIDLQATLQRRQKLAEELQTVEKQVNSVVFSAFACTSKAVSHIQLIECVCVCLDRFMTWRQDTLKIPTHWAMP